MQLDTIRSVDSFDFGIHCIISIQPSHVNAKIQPPLIQCSQICRLGLAMKPPHKKRLLFVTLISAQLSQGNICSYSYSYIIDSFWWYRAVLLEDAVAIFFCHSYGGRTLQ